MAMSKELTTATASMKSLSIGPRRPPNARMVQNFHLVWLDGSIDDTNNGDCRHSITELQKVVSTANTFIDADECIDFITDTDEVKTFMLVSGEFSQIIVPVVQHMSQVNSIYIFCQNKMWYEKLPKEWTKVKGVYADITSICEVLHQATQECDRNSVSISFVRSTDEVSKENLDQLDSSFMYTQILKEILLTIDFGKEHINEFLTYCRGQFIGNTTKLKNVDKIQKEYHDHQPIWWYTSDCFLYSMLNRALRLMEVGLIIKMGFFVRDLHQHIVALHSIQHNKQNHSDSFTVYRGQGLSQVDFDQLMKTKGGLLSFNNFLSTSLDRAVSLAFAESNQYNPDLTGVLFEIMINPTIFLSPFANVGDVSYYQGEEEILFSMHSVFRIDQVKTIDGNGRLWQVKLTLTDDNDSQLQALTKSIQEGTEGLTGWLRLGQLMLRIGQFNKAEELYQISLTQTDNEGERAESFHHLGCSKHGLGKYPEALLYYEKALEIWQKTLPANHPHLATFYNNIGFVYDSMGEYSKTLSYYEKAFEIGQKTLPANHPHLAASLGKIGVAYTNMGDYPKALSYYEKALEIQQKTLPANHPYLATSLSNIGVAYNKMGEYPKALSYYEKALEIWQKTLPANHPHLATSYNNIGLVYGSMGDYSKAISYYEKALAIRQKTLPTNHPNLPTSYNNIGLVYENMGEYSKALSYYEKTLEIFQKTLPANHPHLATSYNNIGVVYGKIGVHQKALSYYEKALEIQQKTLPPNHPDLARSYSNTAQIYYKIGDYFSAHSFIQRAVNIGEHSLSAVHPDLQQYRAGLELLKKKL